MKYLSPQQLLIIHDQLIKRFGGSFGLRDLGFLESAVSRPKASFDGDDLYPTVFEKAAALFHLLLENYPFIDGNKRTALTSAGLFLKINGITLINRHKEESEFALKVENESLSFEEIADWFKINFNICYLSVLYRCLVYNSIVMHNWSTDITELKKNPEKYTI